MGISHSAESEKEIKRLEEIRFNLQNKECIVKVDGLTPSSSLNSYIRNSLHLTGTKVMCREGGCGSCVVILQNKDPITQKDKFVAVNSCLIPILSCNGWNIFTVEGIGDPVKGYHPIQKVLASFNGTQCGFCSPGMVMNMYGLYESGKLTVGDVENAFGGSICRCTGYRPILSAFKSLCKDADEDMLGTLPDIEDLKVCDKVACDNDLTVYNVEPFYHLIQDSRWVKVHSLKDLLTVLKTNLSYTLVAGSTAHGVFSSYSNVVELYVEITSVPELTTYEMENDLFVVGGNVPLSSAMDIFKTISQNSGFLYLKQVANHIDLIANVPVRNRGTLAGNLMMKHDHHEFPSDIFLLLETVGAKIRIVSTNNKETVLSPKDFINFNMKGNVIKNIAFQQYPNSVKFVSYKIMPRAQNVHALVNAGFLFMFGSNSLITQATIVYGNINPTFVHATKSEQILVGKNVYDNNTLKQVFVSLSRELDPDLIPPDATPEYRKQLAIALFYKAVLNFAPDSKISGRNKSGKSLLDRPISRGVQDYETKESLYPLTQPISKIEALAQTSGQAQYIPDMPDLPKQLFGALVLAEAAPSSKIININARRALENKDIVAFFSKDDIPGDNNFTPSGVPFLTSKEQIFCSDRVQYYEQPIGILVGTNEEEVLKAVSSVDVTYEASNLEPLLTVRQVLKSNRKNRVYPNTPITPTRKGTDIKHVIQGSFDIYHQYHFHMETQCVNVVPTEDGLDVYPSSQWMDLIQIAISRMLKIPNNNVNVFVRRCGGAFGAKISRNGIVSCAAALAAWKLRRPVKLSLPLTVNMAVCGKRWPLSVDYEIGVDDRGVIQYLNTQLYTDVGAQRNEDNSGDILNLFLGNYISDTFQVNVYKVITDTHVNTWARAPGSTEGLGAIEAILEHVASYLNLDPLEVRVANFVQNSPLLKYIDDIKAWADIDKRKQDIVQFNRNNRWRKRGLAVVPMTYKLEIAGPFGAMVTIFHGDGSVQVSHGGVEIGQGINTKVAQVCAYKLGIPLDQVAVVPSNSTSAANSLTTGGSQTSEAVCYGVIQACDQLLERIKPVREKWKDAAWPELIQKCFNEFVDLTARGQFSPAEPTVSGYPIYGVCACEVLVDVLTGQYLITRVDLLEDTGQSMSPLIDIGQVEGAFVMGMGYHTTEQIVFSYEGRILTNNTWTYHPPGAKDIPVEFNVKFPKNNPNPVGVLQSKATGEPAVCLTICVPLAIRNAVASARQEADSSSSKWYSIDGPTSVENVFLNCLNDFEQYTL